MSHGHPRYFSTSPVHSPSTSSTVSKMWQQPPQVSHPGTRHLHYFRKLCLHNVAGVLHGVGLNFTLKDSSGLPGRPALCFGECALLRTHFKWQDWSHWRDNAMLVHCSQDTACCGICSLGHLPRVVRGNWPKVTPWKRGTGLMWPLERSESPEWDMLGSFLRPNLEVMVGFLFSFFVEQESQCLRRCKACHLGAHTVFFIL
jgi:hypothetical protein